VFTNGGMDDLDIYETALDLIKKFGREARVEAAMRSDRMFDRGDQHAVGQWNKVMQAVEELQSPGFRLRH
jgi:hypothetical protein